MKVNVSNLMLLMQGAWETKILSVAIEIELFTRISKGATSIDKLSEESGIDVRVLGMLVNACKAIGLITERAGKISNTQDAELFLVKDMEEYMGDFVLLVGGEYYDAWRGVKDVVMTGRPIRDDRTVRLSNPRYAELYNKAMHGLTRMHAIEIARQLKLKGKLLEVGGGQGTYSAEFVKKNVGLSATVFDSPFSCDATENYIEEHGIKNVSTQAGDYVMGSIPKGNDVIMLTNVLHGMSPEKCEALLKNVFDVLPKGGCVIINEFRLEKDGVSPPFSALFAMNAFMFSNGGSLYPYSQILEWLSGLGFQTVKVINTSFEFLVTIKAEKV